MIRKIQIIAIMIIILLFTGACGSNNTVLDGQADSQVSQNGQPAGGPGGQQGFQSADLSGEVVSIDGSKVELKLVEMPQFNRGSRQGNTSGGAIGGYGGKAPGDKPGNTSGSTAGGKTRNTSGAGIGGNGSNTAPGNGQRPQMTYNYTGESKTVTIPDGVEITTTQMENNGIKQTAVQLADIKQGDILQIWYSDKSSETISKISIRNK